MGTIWRIAWRNLGRNRRRTAVTGAAMALGIALCIGMWGLTEGMGVELIRTATRLELGHVQVHAPEYPKRRSLRLAVEQPDALLAAMDRLPGTHGAAARAYTWALLSVDVRSTGVELVGLDPAREPTVTEIFSKVVRGTALPEAPTPWPEGRALTDEERAVDEAATRAAADAAIDELDALPGLDTAPVPAATPLPAAKPTADEGTRALVRELNPPPSAPPPVLLGERLARAMGADVGDEVWLLSSTLDGLVAQERFRVAGVFRTGTPTIDRNRAYLHLRDLQRFARLGARAHELVALAATKDDAAALATAIAALPEAKGLLVRPWFEVQPMIRRMLDLTDVSMGVLLGIILTVAALGVLNTMLMAVSERTRELGVLMALGMRPGGVRGLIVAETVLLSLLGGVVGTALGLLLDAWLYHHGIDLTSLNEGVTMSGFNLDPIWRASVTAKSVLVPVVVMVVTTFAASLYPARRAARLSPTAAMREV